MDVEHTKVDEEEQPDDAMDVDRYQGGKRRREASLALPMFFANLQTGGSHSEAEEEERPHRRSRPRR